MEKFLYLTVDLLSLAFPLMFSFYPKANFSKTWKFLWPALFIPAALFITWDIIFTHMGVWGFNPKYITGIYVYNLPLEEVLFFLCIPYSCVFLYEALNHLIKRDFFQPYEPSISILLVSFLFIIGIINIQRWYTGVTCMACAAFIAIKQWKWRSPFMGRFYFSFLFTLIPFFIVNGILTGRVTDEPVVWYNPEEMLGIRMGTIPAEDTFYGMLLILLNITLFETWRRRSLTTNAIKP